MAETKEHAIYVYEHENHSSFSSMTFAKVALLTEVEENKNILIGIHIMTNFYLIFVAMDN